MLRIIGMRLLQLVFVLPGVTLTAFVVVNVLPGNVLFAILGPNYSDEAAARVSHDLHLDQPVLLRYWDWLWKFLHGDLANSIIDNSSVGHSLMSAAPATFELVLISQVIAIFMAFSLSVLAVAWSKVWVDRVVTGISLLGNSVPPFVTALIGLMVFSQHWHFFPSLGWVSPSEGGWWENIHALILPAITLAIAIVPGYMRVFRREMQDQLELEEYVTLARMKDIRHSRLMLKHVARNSAPGFITLIGLNSGLLIGLAVIIEQIFAIPGIGSLLLNGIQQRDVPVIQGCLVVIATAVVLFNLLADLAYAALDPRVRADA